MGKRKGRQSEMSETLNRKEQDDDEKLQEEEEKGEKGKGGGGFFACYLLTSLSPRHKGQTYIGFTVNPKRRIRQHNGEIGSGAWRTKKKRPWEMVLCIYSFPTNVAALQFEWAWQHPVESLAVRRAAVNFKSLSGIANKIKLAYTMLTLPTWQSMNLNVNFFSTKYTKHYAGCPSLPPHMKVHVCSMDELPCYTGGDDQNMFEDDVWDDEGDEVCDGSGSGGSSEPVEEVFEDVMLAAPVRQSADNQNNIQENTLRQWNSSSCLDGGQFCLRDSPERAHPSFGTSSYSSVGIVRDSGLSPLIQDECVALDSPSRKKISTVVADIQNNIQEPVLPQQNGICLDGEPFSLGDSPDRAFPSFTRSSYSPVEIVRVNTGLSPLIQKKLDWPTRKKILTVVADKDQPLNKSRAFPPQVEVIDVFSPSPERRKKRAGSSVSPQIIDLTESPILG